MKRPETAMQPNSRSQVIGAIVTEAVLKSRMDWNEYAECVVDHYHANVGIHDRAVSFHVATSADNSEKCRRLNTQTVRRVLLGEIRMTVDLEESLVAALPEAWGTELQTRLLERAGLLFARRPAPIGDVPGQLRCPADLLRSTAETVQALAPMFADNNSIGPEDSRHFGKALREINETMGVLVGLNRQITQAMEAGAAGGAGQA
ncbi:MAG TPA: hypothetical protein DD456_13545 [Stenotrophomonas sp.]|nr:hypothetical protein [Stenotrophomonas sp.]